MLFLYLSLWRLLLLFRLFLLLSIWRDIYIPSLCYNCNIIILVFWSFIFANVLCLYAFLCISLQLGICSVLIHPLLVHSKMTVPSQKYDSCYPCVWAFDFAIWLRTILFEFASKVSFFGNLFFYIYHMGSI